MARNINDWIRENTGKHFCQCGCGKEIVITKNHATNGIPTFYVGHSQRKHHPLAYLDGEEKDCWVLSESGKHFCKCGCGQPIVIKKHHIDIGIPKFIAGHYSRTVKYPSDVERFWMKVDVGDKDECWDWKASKKSTGGGYGNFRTSNKNAKGLAHRFSYILNKGDFDGGLDVLHTCDNPKCVNPNHLFLGTQSDNNKDAARKGKFAKKLTATDAREIVLLVKSGIKKSYIARQFGITPPSLWAIMKGIAWSHATGIER